MAHFEVQSRGIRPESRAPHFTITEGAYKGGMYHLINLGSRGLRAELGVPKQFHDQSFLVGANQALGHGRMTDITLTREAQAKAKEFQGAGQPLLSEFVLTHPNVVFISDASNSPFNEGHFIIQDGKLLPLPPDSQAVSGRHYVLKTSGDKISFPLVDTQDENSVRAVGEGFFVPKIIHEGKAIGLLDEVPGTGQLSIADYRGHIGQLFIETAYAEHGSPKKAFIHTRLLDYLRDPINYRAVLQDIVSGRAVNFGEFGDVIFPQNTFNHTYWIEAESGEIYCFKTLPALAGMPAPGVRFADGPNLLFEVANEHGFGIRNAFIGTNGKDVRVILNQDGKLEPLSLSLEGAAFGKHLERPIANFIAFSSTGTNSIGINTRIAPPVEDSVLKGITMEQGTQILKVPQNGVLKNLTLQGGASSLSNWATLRGAVIKFDPTRTTSIQIDGKGFEIPSGYTLMDESTFTFVKDKKNNGEEISFVALDALSGERLYLVHSSYCHPDQLFLPKGSYTHGQFSPTNINVEHMKLESGTLYVDESELDTQFTKTGIRPNILEGINPIRIIIKLKEGGQLQLTQ